MNSEANHLGERSAGSEKFFAPRFIFPKLQMQLAPDVHKDIIRLIALRTKLEPAMETSTRRWYDGQLDKQESGSTIRGGRLEIMASDVTTRDL